MLKKTKSIADEMNTPQREIQKGMPIFEESSASDFVEPKKEEKKDYLDEQPQVPTTNRNFSQPLLFNDDRTDNLIMWQLRVDWERIEHIIRGHKPQIDKEGNEYFVRIKEHYLNEHGVNSILKFLSFYLSKEIFLARYDLEEVNLIMKQFSRQFTDFFFDNIEEFGLDTNEKKKMSKMFVHSVIALVDASYSKAIEGKTAELINKQFQVLQQQPLYDSNYNPNQNSNPQKREPNIFQRIFN